MGISLARYARAQGETPTTPLASWNDRPAKQATTFNRLYIELLHQPMIEVMRHLCANRYATYIVSGGGQDFICSYGPCVYGVPPEQIIGTSPATTKYKAENGKPKIVRLSKLLLDCNFGGKVVGIDLFIGKRPYADFGNSTGDRQMLE